MSSRPTILVTGATGAQGGSVARHLLASGRYAVRALTRDPESEKAKALAAAGADLARGDLSDPAALRAALAGCDGAFGVTNFWEHFGKELEQGRNLIEAVAAAGVQRFVFSSLPSIEKISGGELKSPHFDIKARLEDHARGLGVPAAFVQLAFYYENFLYFFPPKRQADGSFRFGFPQGDTPLAGLSVADLGGVVLPIFDRFAEFRGQAFYVAGDDLPAARYAELMSRALGVNVVYEHVPREVFAGFGFPGAEDLADMFDFYRRYVPSRAQDVAASRALYPRLQSFETWVAANRERFQPVLAA
jgi:uncharacterized protein YbjT (DUF2867 family)